MSINIVLFGEAGVGKSSIINIMARRKVADTSDWGCTSESKQYTFQVAKSTFNIWDTIGLGDPAFGDSNRAIEKTHALIQQIEAQGRLDLLLFCIPGSRVTSTMQYNYRLFFEVLCEKRIPIAVVVTRLDGEAKLEEWWVRNSEFLSQCGLQFSGHACVVGRPGHPKETEGRAALELLLLCFDQGGRDPMPPASDFPQGLPQSKSKDEQKDVEQLPRDRHMMRAVTAIQLAGSITSGHRPSLAFRLNDDDIVVFVVGPFGSGKSMFVDAVTQFRGLVGISTSLQASAGKVEAIRCELTAEARNALGAEEQKNIVFVDTPSFHIDPYENFKAEREMSSWLKKSKSKSSRVGTIYMHRIDIDPTFDFMQDHLDAFAGTFPRDFVTRASSMRLHCVFSYVNGIKEEKILDHQEKFQRQLSNLRPKIVHGHRLRWNDSIHPDLFVEGDPYTAWNAVYKLFGLG